MEDKRYEEAGTNYRFFLNWRHASFAGYLVVLYGVLYLTLTALEKTPALAFVIPLIGSPVGLLFWLIDVRTRDLYHSAIRAGRTLEGEGGGFYTQLVEHAVVPPGTSPFSRVTQSGALNLLFLGGTIVLFLAGVALSVFEAIRRSCG